MPPQLKLKLDTDQAIALLLETAMVGARASRVYVDTMIAALENRDWPLAATAAMVATGTVQAVEDSARSMSAMELTNEYSVSKDRDGTFAKMDALFDEASTKIGEIAEMRGLDGDIDRMAESYAETLGITVEQLVAKLEETGGGS